MSDTSRTERPKNDNYVSPKRVQLRRAKGWRKPAGTINCARPSVYGNPFVVRPAGPGAFEVPGVIGPVSEMTARGCAVQAFRHALSRGELDITEGFVRDTLAGHDLACWCRLDQRCHVDVLLEVANSPASHNAHGGSCDD